MVTGKSNRGSYKKQECPYCKPPRFFGNLANHIRMKHQAAEVDPETQEDQAVVISKESLGLGKEKAEEKPGGTTYYCQDCKAIVRKGELKCWQCHVALIWEGIE